MPKQKTHKGLAKRVRVTKTGKVMRGQAGARHLLSTKSGKRKRQLRSTASVAAVDEARIKRALLGN
jgi:large subunit ribosomal protein L35